MAKADASTSATAPTLCMALAIIALDATGSFLFIGIARDDTWAWTPGATLYLSETAGAITATAPTVTDTVTQVLGVATHADRMYFKPSADIVTHT